MTSSSGAAFALLTDYGTGSPYVGQVHAALHAHSARLPVVDLYHGLDPYCVDRAAYLAAAWCTGLTAGSIVVAVVDPGVGGNRRPIIVRANELWFVGPDNGLLSIVARRARSVQAWEIVWRPGSMTATFHGRDLFAPIAAMLSHVTEDNLSPEIATPLAPNEIDRPEWPDDLAQIIYIDWYGNAATGIRAEQISRAAIVSVLDHNLSYARTFSEAAPGCGFWYENANGLMEIAWPNGSAGAELALAIGVPVQVGLPQ